MTAKLPHKMNVSLVHCPSQFCTLPQNQPLLVCLYQRGPLTANCSLTFSSPLFLSARLKPRRWRSRRRRRRRRRRRPTMLRRHHEACCSHSLLPLPAPPAACRPFLLSSHPHVHTHSCTRKHTLYISSTKSVSPLPAFRETWRFIFYQCAASIRSPTLLNFSHSLCLRIQLIPDWTVWDVCPAFPLS